MDVEKYNQLPINERANKLWVSGKFIDSHSEYGKAKIALYLMEDSIVAVYYDINTNKITDIKAWAKGADKAQVLATIGMN